MTGPINDELLRDAVMTGCNDGDLVQRFRSGQVSMREFARMVSRDVQMIRNRRLFDELFYEPQLEALEEQLASKLLHTRPS